MKLNLQGKVSLIFDLQWTGYCVDYCLNLTPFKWAHEMLDICSELIYSEVFYAEILLYLQKEKHFWVELMSPEVLSIFNY